jgi:ectoine hydroxylase-related dioxygenase (phytanoyl-CoA dioxygenase family)
LTVLGRPGKLRNAAQKMGYNRSLSEFSREGYVVLDPFLPRERAAELYRAFDALALGHSPSSVPGAPPGRKQANERILVQDGRFVELLREPSLLEAVECALGSEAHLLAYEAIEIPPGCGTARDWHCDFHFDSEAPLVVNVAIYLQDMLDSSGPLYVIPGSHRCRREPDEAEVGVSLPGEVKVDVRAGGAVVFHGRLWHTGSDNQSAKPRRALFPYFGQTWIKRMDDFYRRPLPTEIQETKDPLLRKLFSLDPGTLVHGATYVASNRDWL